MSKFLAPIHHGLYKKIILFENIEKLIVTKTNRADGHKILVERWGDYLPVTALEDIIDHDNIHGWLQKVITASEKRHAALVFALSKADLLEEVREAYYEIGLETGQFFDGNAASEIFAHVTTVLLDGMPCDRVNEIIGQDDESVQWKTVNCVHEENWTSQGVDVMLYYKFRTAFIKGFIENINKSYSYSFSNEYKLHEIKKA